MNQRLNTIFVFTNICKYNRTFSSVDIVDIVDKCRIRICSEILARTNGSQEMNFLIFRFL